MRSPSPMARCAGLAPFKLSSNLSLTRSLAPREYLRVDPRVRVQSAAQSRHSTGRRPERQSSRSTSTSSCQWPRRGTRKWRCSDRNWRCTRRRAGKRRSTPPWRKRCPASVGRGATLGRVARSSTSMFASEGSVIDTLRAHWRLCAHSTPRLARGWPGCARRIAGSTRRRR